MPTWHLARGTIQNSIANVQAHFPSSSSSRFPRPPARVFRAYKWACLQATILEHLGDHLGLPLLHGVSTDDILVSLVLKFHGDGRESLTIYKATKYDKVSAKKRMG